MRVLAAVVLVSGLSCTFGPRPAVPIALPIDAAPLAKTMPPVVASTARPDDRLLSATPTFGPQSSPDVVKVEPVPTVPTTAATVPTRPPLTTSPVPQVRAVDAPVMPSFDAAMSSVIAQGYPGGSLAVVRDGKLIHARGYGEAREGVAATATTRYRQASISKAVTASLLAKVVADGALSLGLRVFPFFGIAPVDPRANAITVRMLRDHTSGIAGDYFVREPRQAATHYGVPSPPDVDTMVRWTARHMLAAEPGSAYSYNNTNYAILSRVIEKVTGRPWIDLVREMAKPLGVGSWRVDAGVDDPADEPRYHEAAAYRFMPSVFDSVHGIVEAPYGGYDGAALAGATALVSTVIDMARYAQAVAVGAIRTPEAEPIPTKPGWLYTYVYNGSMPGHYTFLMRIWNGANLTVISGAFNHRDAGPIDRTINARILEAYRATTAWPTVDLFPKY